MIRKFSFIRIHQTIHKIHVKVQEDVCVCAHVRACHQQYAHCTALNCVKPRRCLTHSMLNGQKGLSEVRRYRQIPLQRYKNFTVIITLWVTFKVGKLNFPFLQFHKFFLIQERQKLFCALN